MKRYILFIGLAVLVFSCLKNESYMEINDGTDIVLKTKNDFHQLNMHLIHTFDLEVETLDVSDPVFLKSILVYDEDPSFFDRLRGIDKLQYRLVFTYNLSTASYDLKTTWNKVKNGNYALLEDYENDAIQSNDILRELVNWKE